MLVPTHHCGRIRAARCFQQLISHAVEHTDVVFPGALPRTVQRQHIEVPRQSQQERGRGRTIRRERELRLLSAASHLWIDRIRIFNEKGDVDEAGREKLLNDHANRYWDRRKEDVYITPKIEAVDGRESFPSDVALASLLDSKSSCMDAGLTVLYGPVGSARRFFLHRLTNKLGTRAKEDILLQHSGLCPASGSPFPGGP